MSKYVLDFTLKGLPRMGLNTNGNWRVKWAKAKAVKRDVWRAVWAKRPSEPLEKAKVRIERCSSVRPDYDNLVSSGKHLLDGLVEAGILAGDTFDHIGTPEYVWSKAAPGMGHVNVRVEAA